MSSTSVYQLSEVAWGTFDENITVGDEVAVFGAYVEDETGCSVTLEGSADYYFMPVAEETDEEAAEGEVTEETTEEPAEETTEETT